MATPLDPYQPYRSSYDVHPECDAFTEISASMRLQPYAVLTVEQARQQSRRAGIVMGGNIPFDGSITHQTIPSPAVPDGIPITIYKPSSLAEKPAIFVYLHGGGLVLGSIESYDTVIKNVARESRAIVVCVKYRLLPLPKDLTAPFDDALVAVRWILDNKVLLAGHPHSKVGVGGDSAGGQLTACVTNDIQEIDFQVLIYPMADVSRRQPSFQEFEVCPGLTKLTLEWLFSHSIDKIQDAVNNPKINPMARNNAELSPPALVLLAEMDALRDPGIEYANKLKDAGVPVELEIVRGVPHAFFPLAVVFKTTCEFAHSRVARFIGKFQ